LILADHNFYISKGSTTADDLIDTWHSYTPALLWACNAKYHTCYNRD